MTNQAGKGKSDDRQVTIEIGVAISIYDSQTKDLLSVYKNEYETIDDTIKALLEIKKEEHE